MSQGESSDESVLAASCDLLLSCLPQVANPGRKFGECLLQLLVPQSGSGTDAAPQVAAALMLVKHLLSGEHPGLTAAGEEGLVVVATAGWEGRHGLLFLEVMA